MNTVPKIGGDTLVRDYSLSSSSPNADQSILIVGEVGKLILPAPSDSNLTKPADTKHTIVSLLLTRNSLKV